MDAQEQVIDVAKNNKTFVRLMHSSYGQYS